MKKIALHAVATVALLAFSHPASSTDVFRLEGYGAVSRGLGGAATAVDVGAPGMMTNPATLSLIREGASVHLGLDMVNTDIDVRNQVTGEAVSSNSHSHNRGPYVAPEAAFVYRRGALALGVGAFAQGGLGTEYGSSSFLSRATGGLESGLENSSRLLVLSIPFAVSYAVDERLTIGGSLDAVWQGLNLELLLGADQVGSLIGSGRASGSLIGVLAGLPDLRGAHFSLTRDQPLNSGVDAWGFSGRFGLTYKATDATLLGAAYTLEASMDDMKGRATLTAIDGAAGQIPLNGRIKLRDFKMPAHLDFGVSHRIDSRWLVAADISRVFWRHAMKDINVGFIADGGIGNIDILLPQGYRDQTVLSVGMAYGVDNWTWRGGFRIASQALRSETLFAVIPAIPRKHLSAGLSYNFPAGSRIDVAYSHAFKQSMSNSTLPNTSDPIKISHSQNNMSLAYVLPF